MKSGGSKKCPGEANCEDLTSQTCQYTCSVISLFVLSLQRDEGKWRRLDLFERRNFLFLFSTTEQSAVVKLLSLFLRSSFLLVSSLNWRCLKLRSFLLLLPLPYWRCRLLNGMQRKVCSLFLPFSCLSCFAWLLFCWKKEEFHTAELEQERKHTGKLLNLSLFPFAIMTHSSSRHRFYRCCCVFDEQMWEWAQIVTDLQSASQLMFSFVSLPVQFADLICICIWMNYLLEQCTRSDVTAFLLSSVFSVPFLFNSEYFSCLSSQSGWYSGSRIYGHHWGNRLGCSQCCSGLFICCLFEIEIVSFWYFFLLFVRVIVLLQVLSLVVVLVSSARMATFLVVTWPIPRKKWSSCMEPRLLASSDTLISVSLFPNSLTWFSLALSLFYQFRLLSHCSFVCLFALLCFFSAGGYPGGQAEYVLVPFGDVNLLKVPSNLRDEQVLFLRSANSCSSCIAIPSLPSSHFLLLHWLCFASALVTWLARVGMPASWARCSEAISLWCGDADLSEQVRNASDPFLLTLSYVVDSWPFSLSLLLSIPFCSLPFDELHLHLVCFLFSSSSLLLLSLLFISGDDVGKASRCCSCDRHWQRPLQTAVCHAEAWSRDDQLWWTRRHSEIERVAARAWSWCLHWLCGLPLRKELVATSAEIAQAGDRCDRHPQWNDCCSAQVWASLHHWCVTAIS